MKHFARVVLFYGAVFLAAPRTGAQPASQGPASPGAVNVEFPGCLACPGSEWLNPVQATAYDSLFATVPLFAYPTCFQSVCYFSRGLLAMDFGFSVPANATITGIVADILRRGATSGAVRDSAVRLLKNGMATGSPKAGPNPWPLMAQYETYGDSTDLWGAAWTPADVNDSQFGLFLRCSNKSGATDTASVDHIRLTVFYQVPTGIAPGGAVMTGVYYDPVSAALVVGGPAGAGRWVLHVTDAAGRIVFTGRGQRRYDVGHLAPGVYFARWPGPGGRVTRFIAGE